MGRKHISEEQLKRALIKHKGFISHTAKYLKIARNTIYEYFKEWPHLKEIHLEQIDLREDDIVLAQYDSACGLKTKDKDGNVYTTRPDTGAAKLILTFLHGYSDRQENNNINQDKLVETFKAVSDEIGFTPITDVDDEA